MLRIYLRQIDAQNGGGTKIYAIWEPSGQNPSSDNYVFEINVVATSTSLTDSNLQQENAYQFDGFPDQDPGWLTNNGIR